MNRDSTPRRSRKINKRSRNTILDYQNLEPKCLLAGISFDAGTGVVTVDGSSGNDRVRVFDESTALVRVVFDGVGDEIFNRSEVNEIVFTAGAGNDRFRNETSIASTAFGQGGDDLLVGGSGDDNLRGGPGNDRLGGKDGNDILAGDDGDDLVFGGGGDDFVYGSSGNDRLNGQSGDDSIFAGEGDDFVNGSNGRDQIFGQAGNDTLRGGSGDDDIAGDDGDDSIRGNKGNDLLSGNIGRDLVFGGLNDDLLYGGDDSDRLYGNRGLDDLNGGSGNDDLYGGRDADQLVGDAGNDDYYSDASDHIVDDSSDSSSNGDFEIRGTISGFNSANQTFQVLGITVNYSSAEFVANVNNGSFVKVEGSYNGTILQAHEVENELNDNRNENFEARGIVTGLNTGAQTFSFYGFSVGYSNARLDAQPVNGQPIVVEGHLTGTTIVASRLKPGGSTNNPGGGNGGGNGGDNNPGNNGSVNGDLEVRGEISNFNPTARTFTVLGFTVNYSSAQQQGNFGNGSFVKVDGQYNGNQINAREVEIELDDDRDENIQITGAISNLDTNNQTFQLLGFTVRFDNARVETSLFNGNSVEVEGFFANGLIDAEEIS